MARLGLQKLPRSALAKSDQAARPKLPKILTISKFPTAYNYGYLTMRKILLNIASFSFNLKFKHVT